MGKLILTTALLARHDVLSKANKVQPLTVYFKESDIPLGTGTDFWDNAINSLSRSQNINSDDLEPIRKLTNSIAEDMAGKTRQFVFDRVQAITTQAILEGISVAEFQTRLAEYSSDSGLDPARPYLTENLLRTQTGIGYGAGEQAAYNDPDITDIIWGYKYVATHDDRVRPSHLALDGVTLPKDDPFWSTHWPGSFDWNCRCTHEIILADETHKIKRRTPKDDGFGLNLGSLVDLLAGL